MFLKFGLEIGKFLLFAVTIWPECGGCHAVFEGSGVVREFSGYAQTGAQ